MKAKGPGLRNYSLSGGVTQAARVGATAGRAGAAEAEEAAEAAAEAAAEEEELLLGCI